MTSNPLASGALTIPYDVWHDLTSRVAHFASTDGTTPILASVRVFERGGRLMAEASNRYVLGFAAAPAMEEPVPAGFSIVLTVRSLTQMAKALGVTARTRSMVSLILDPDEAGKAVHVTATGLLALGEMSMTIPSPGGKFPPLANLASASRDHDVSPAPAFSPWLLGIIAKAVRFDVVLEQHGNEPAYFEERGGELAGLIVPIRGGGAEKTLLDLYAPALAVETSEPEEKSA